MNVNDVIARASELYQAHAPSLRWGQAVYTAASDLDVYTARSIAGTYEDCYHDDSKVEAFLAAFTTYSERKAD